MKEISSTTYPAIVAFAGPDNYQTNSYTKHYGTFKRTSRFKEVLP